MCIRKLFIGISFCFFVSTSARADFWGGDIPLLIEIVANTLNTLKELKEQSSLLKKELRGIDDTIKRLNSIQEIIAPNDLSAWKDPREAMRRLQRIYFELPRSFRTEKSVEIETRLSQSMSVAGKLTEDAKPSFRSGKELEKRGLEVGPAVANKMTASGIGTLVALQSQNQVAQATIISLLSQMIADSGSKDVAELKSHSKEFKTVGNGMKGFSNQIGLMEVKR